MPEFKILLNVLDYMEATGNTYKTVRVSIDEKLVEEINAANSTNYSLEDLQSAADKCIAHEWLQQRALRYGPYGNLCITPKGVGAARSKRKSEEIKASRSLLKKASDYIEDHKGLFVVLGFLLGLATFALKIFGDK
ncbi:hypothetical protein [Endozoicomonas atrinae]|uniref:hypothetical protein n=1 Tax=Endozoicomonas atrinae TaxID=1333660 RepID=UPI003AFFA929